MNNEQTSCEAGMADLLDRLACGDLEESSRRQLLAWLEEEPQRWRLCGMAFLEAQAWSQALGEWPGTCSSRRVVSRRASPAIDGPDARRGRRFLAACMAAGAACLVAAFGLGFSLHAAISPAGLASQGRTAEGAATAPQDRSIEQPAARPNRKPSPVLASLRVYPSAGLGTSQVHVPVAPGKPHDESPVGEIPEHVRRRWERQGYKLSVERRYLFAKLPDGQQIVVPVEQILVNHVPPKVY